MRVKIEKALFFHNIHTISKRKISGRIIAIGSEFCPRLLPSLQEITDIFSLKPSKIMLYTSFLGEGEIKETIKRLEGILSLFGSKIEVMVNDFGILRWLNMAFPKIEKGIARPLSIEFMRMRYDDLVKIMKDYRIKAIETDEYSLINNFPEKREFLIYFRYKMKFVATSRFCPFVRKIDESCNLECHGKILKLTSFHLPFDIYCFEKGYFQPQPLPSSFPFNRIIYDIF